VLGVSSRENHLRLTDRPAAREHRERHLMAICCVERSESLSVSYRYKPVGDVHVFYRDARPDGISKDSLRSSNRAISARPGWGCLSLTYGKPFYGYSSR
jgi:hypothetical protein